MSLPHFVVSTNAALQARDSALPSKLADIGDGIKNLVLGSNSISHELFNANVWAPDDGPSWNDVQLTVGSPGVAVTDDAKKIAPLVDQYLSLLSTVVSATDLSARVHAARAYQTTLNQFTFTYPQAYVDFSKVVASVLAAYDDVIKTQIQSATDQLAAVNRNIDTLEHNLDMYDLNIAGLAIGASVTGFVGAGSAAAYRAELLDLTSAGVSLSKAYLDLIKEQIDLREGTEADEQSLSDWRDTQSAAENLLNSAQNVRRLVDAYPSAVTTSKSNYADQVNAYLSTLKSDTASVAQWTEQNSNGGTLTPMPAILQTFKDTGSCYYTGDQDKLQEWAQDLWVWIKSRV